MVIKFKIKFKSRSKKVMIGKKILDIQQFYIIFVHFLKKLLLFLNNHCFIG